MDERLYKDGDTQPIPVVEPRYDSAYHPSREISNLLTERAGQPLSDSDVSRIFSDYYGEEQKSAPLALRFGQGGVRGFLTNPALNLHAVARVGIMLPAFLFFGMLVMGNILGAVTGNLTNFHNHLAGQDANALPTVAYLFLGGISAMAAASAFRGMIKGNLRALDVIFMAIPMILIAFGISPMA